MFLDKLLLPDLKWFRLELLYQNNQARWKIPLYLYFANPKVLDYCTAPHTLNHSVFLQNPVRMNNFLLKANFKMNLATS